MTVAAPIAPLVGAAPPDAEALGLRFHHVGVAVPDMAAALEVYLDVLGCRRVAGPIEVPSQRVRVCFVEAGPGVLIELVEGLGEGSPVSGILERSGAGPYHLCFEVEDLDRALEALAARGCRRPMRFEQPGHGLRRFAFLLTPDRQLVELCEPDRPRARSRRSPAAERA